MAVPAPLIPDTGVQDLPRAVQMAKRGVEFTHRRETSYMLLLLLALVAQSGRAQNCRTIERDKTAVVQALRTLYAGATVDDMAKMHTVTAPKFYAFDGGAQFSSIDDLIKVVRQDQVQGVKYVWAVTEPQVPIRCKVAWISYLNDGSVQGAEQFTCPHAVARVRNPEKTWWDLENSFLPKYPCAAVNPISELRVQPSQLKLREPAR